MTNSITINVLEILISKIAHDLISPIGAVNNGVEFVQEMGLENAGDAVDLIAFSAGQASAKLQAYRMAYGSGGADNSIKPEDVYNIIEAIVSAEEKIRQDWEADPLIGMSEQTGERPNGFGKILVCAFLLAMDALPKGGVLGLNVHSQTEIEVTASGENASFRDRYDEALSLAILDSELEPKFIHPYAMGLFQQQYGFQISFNNSTDGQVGIRITMPS